MYWWNDQFSVLRREYLTARRRYIRLKGDARLHAPWKTVKTAPRQGLKKNRFQFWEDLIGDRNGPMGSHLQNSYQEIGN